MEKLIELLNEWERERVNHNTKEYIKRGKTSFTGVWIIEVISKSYWFIKRLVDKDKIDKEKVIKAETLPILDINEDYVLMLLAIQDNPIDVLISILK